MIRNNYTCYNTEDLEELIAYTHRICGPEGVRYQLYQQSSSEEKRYSKLSVTEEDFLEKEFVFADYYKSSDDIDERVKLKPGDTSSIIRIVKPADLFENLVESMAVMGAEEPEVPLSVIEEVVYRLASTCQDTGYYYYNSRKIGLRGSDWGIDKCVKMEPPPRVRIMPSPREKRPVQGGMQRRQWISGAADKAKRHLSYAVNQGHSGGKYASDFHRAGMHIDTALAHAIKTGNKELIDALAGKKEDFLRISRAIRHLCSELSEVGEG